MKNSKRLHVFCPKKGDLFLLADKQRACGKKFKTFELNKCCTNFCWHSAAHQFSCVYTNVLLHCINESGLRRALFFTEIQLVHMQCSCSFPCNQEVPTEEKEIGLETKLTSVLHPVLAPRSMSSHPLGEGRVTPWVVYQAHFFLFLALMQWHWSKKIKSVHTYVVSCMSQFYLQGSHKLVAELARAKLCLTFVVNDSLKLWPMTDVKGGPCSEKHKWNKLELPSVSRKHTGDISVLNRRVLRHLVPRCGVFQRYIFPFNGNPTCYTYIFLRWHLEMSNFSDAMFVAQVFVTASFYLFFKLSVGR